MNNPMNLAGKHILVTGASSGIGRATCLLASQLGAKVSLTARNEENLLGTKNLMEGEEHRIFPCDLSDLDAIVPLLKQINEKSGLLDGFVHCMGIGPNRLIHLTKPAFLRNVLDVNFFPFVEMTRNICSRKYSNEKASIVCISSVAGAKGNKAQGAYAASKAAIEGIMRPMAKEYAERNIRVNAVEFGMIYTQLYEGFLALGGQDDSLRDQYLGIGQPSDAANVICFLLSNASRFITGSTLVADGGYLS